MTLALAIPHNGKTIPSNGGIVVAAQGPATDLDRIAASVDVSVTDAKGASVAGSLVLLRTDAKTVNPGTLSRSTLLFRPTQPLAPGERYRARAFFKPEAGSTSTSPLAETAGDIIVGSTPLQLRELAPITSTLTSQASIDSTKPQTCCAIEPTPASYDTCSGSPNGGPSTHCFFSSLTANPRLDVEFNTGLSEIESAFVEHEGYLVEGGVRQKREAQQAKQPTNLHLAGVWSRAESEYCLEVVTRNLLDGTETMAKRCVPHGDLALVPVETPEIRAALRGNLQVCSAPPSGVAALEAPWCEAHATDERCATGKYVAADEGGCSASGRSSSASSLGGLLLALAVACVSLRRARR